MKDLHEDQIEEVLGRSLETCLMKLTVKVIFGYLHEDQIEQVLIRSFRSIELGRLIILK